MTSGAYSALLSVILSLVNMVGSRGVRFNAITTG